MKLIVKINLAALIIIVAIISVSLFYYPHDSAQYALVSGIAQGLFLGTIITGAILSKDIIELARDKKQAQARSARYLTEKYELEAKIKDLKKFEGDICDAVKKLANDMDKFMKEPIIVSYDGFNKPLASPVVPGVKKLYATLNPGDSIVESQVFSAVGT